MPIHKLIQPVEHYKGEKDIAKRIEQSRVTLTTAAKMLAKKREAQKLSTNDRPSEHNFKVGDLVLVLKHNKTKLELKWEPGYRIIKLPTPLTAVVEDQLTGKSKRCNVRDLKVKHPAEDWELKAENIGRAARYVNHPDNLPDIDLTTELTNNHCKNTNSYNLRKTVKPPIKLNL